MLLCLGFAVDKENLLQAAFFLAGYVANQLFVVAMAGPRLDASQVSPHLVDMTKNGDVLVAAHNLGAQGGRLAVSDTEYRGGRIVDIVGQMVLDASGFHHTRS